ncbi:MAG: cell division protein FtsA [Candidatus Jorgensenbacteria bacterium]|nr:cell division protein FtsA [Candidatus Jorgensenbacteria bacterium]
MSSLVTSLDIGSSQIKCIVAAPKKDGTLAVVTAFKRPSAGFKRGVLSDIDDATNTLREVAIDLQRISKRATENVVANLNSEHVWSRSSKGMAAVGRADLEIQQDDIDRAKQAAIAGKVLQNRMLLHNISREFLVDGVGDIADPLGMSGNRLEVSTFIVEAFTPHYAILTKTLERVGLSMNGIVFNPLASQKSVLSKHRKELGALVIDFGFGTTSFAAYEDGRPIHAKSIPIGTSHITSDIVAGFTIPFEVAEKLKVSYGYAISKDIARKDLIRLSEVDPQNNTEVSKKVLSEIIEARLEEILELVNNEIKGLGRNIQFPGGVVITGGGVKMPGMTEFVKQEMKFPTQVGFPDLKNFEITNPAHAELLDDPEFAVAVGLFGNMEESRRADGGGMFEKFKHILRNLTP